MSMDNSKCALFSLHMLFTLLMAVTHPADLPCCHPRSGRAVTALLHQDNKSHVLICQVDELVKGFFWSRSRHGEMLHFRAAGPTSLWWFFC